MSSGISQPRDLIQDVSLNDTPMGNLFIKVFAVFWQN